MFLIRKDFEVAARWCVPNTMTHTEMPRSDSDSETSWAWDFQILECDGAVPSSEGSFAPERREYVWDSGSSISLHFLDQIIFSMSGLDLDTLCVWRCPCYIYRLANCRFLCFILRCDPETWENDWRAGEREAWGVTVTSEAWDLVGLRTRHPT